MPAHPTRDVSKPQKLVRAGSARRLEAQDALPSTIRAGLKIHPDFQESIQNLQLPDKDASQIVRRLIVAPHVIMRPPRTRHFKAAFQIGPPIFSITTSLIAAISRPASRIGGGSDVHDDGVMSPTLLQRRPKASRRCSSNTTVSAPLRTSRAST